MPDKPVFQTYFNCISTVFQLCFKLILIISLLYLYFIFTISLLYPQTAHTNWAKLTKKIAIHPGVKISAWLDRGIVTNMTPAGDGTYIIRLDLTPGYSYNFLFFAETDNNPPTGLSPYYIYYDQVPSRGRILTSINSNGTGWTTNYAYYGAVGKNYDARRIVYVPEFGPGTNFYVFNNFSDRPLPPQKFEALPRDSAIILNWTLPDGNWGQLDANVVGGGSFYIYTNTTGATNNFGLLTNLPGYVTSFTHTGLVNGTTYYYVIVSSDAYTGAAGTALTNMKSELPKPWGVQAAQAYATPKDFMPVYFKVQDIRWDAVEKNNYLVWLTPAEFDARFYFNKFPGRILKVKLK